ncbi:MAG: sigma-70 family RNA polymerase sigma factor [Hyphomicrobiaceae bacterium]|nr:sigma-70 family RNA polymerase sigma factor [Hyphomicrobiaceae bacterium]
MKDQSSGGQNFGGAVAAFRPFLLRLALLQLQDKAAAEDVVQETLLAALAGEASFQRRASLKTWMVSILKYKILDAIRARRRVMPLAPIGPNEEDEYDLTPFDSLFDASGCWAEPQDAWSDPSTVAERTAFFRVLEACLTRLPERASRAFLMREWLEHEPAEICSVLQVTPGNLRILLYRARMQLRVCLDMNWEPRT